ncbi:lipid kinase, YegS/Rv2252/BmrU family [Sphingomonas guangdongensis]|uniref:Lipid kinase, YegS/Rv2252/BmrU family n=1 Tax=Sphingomonas guangdongensis TaxID=1141890 RepID=A0A285R328_9SPHN|nr:diacylglycerol kinase family protein [Sphingomonas guangdongensis]SOB88129.1 lipid kinase, YegS/Rv2252/BmrU family [Sphingomonas guangdongensis]
MTRFRSAALIVNARSRRGQALFKRACAAFADGDLQVDAHAVEDPRELDDVLDRALARNPELVILGGGDGTISGLVDKLVGRGITLGVLPLGTANSFCRTLGIPLDIAGAVEVIKSGVPRTIDLGMIGDDYFANAATMGIAPQIAETVPHGLKKVLGRAGYLSWAALQFIKFKPFWLTVDAGNGPQHLKVVEVRIANGRYHGGTELMEEAEVDSGEIVIECVRGHVKRRLVANWGASLLRLPQRREDVVVFRGKEIRLDSDPRLPISIDGEVLAHTPAVARVAAGVIDVLVPAEAA